MVRERHGDEIVTLRERDYSHLVYSFLRTAEKLDRLERKYQKEKRMNEHNPKTGALSYRGMLRRWTEFKRLSQHRAFAEGKKLSDYQMVFVFGDVTGLKKINEDHGAHIGDRVLRTIARRISRKVLRAGDFVAMPKGDEIYIGIPYERSKTAPAQLAEKARKRAIFFVEESRVRADDGTIIHPEIRLHHLVLGADVDFRRLIKVLDIEFKEKERGRDLDLERVVKKAGIRTPSKT